MPVLLRLLGTLASPATLIVLALGWLAWRRTFAPAFNLHLASAARRSLPLDRAIAALMGDAPLGSGAFLRRVHRRLAEGRSLHEALRTWFRRFPEGYLAALEAAEGTSALPRVLEAQGVVLRRWSDLSLRFVGALLYPVWLGWSLFSIAGVLQVFIVPRFEAMLREMGGGDMTPEDLRLVEFCIGAAGWMIIALFVAGVAFLFVPKRMASLGARVLTLLGMGRAVAVAGLPDFLDQLGILLGSGLPQKEAFAAASRAVWLGSLRSRVENARALWEGGAAFPDALSRAVGIPRWMEMLLRFGEGSGKLPEALEECAGIAREKSWALREGGMKLLFPALVVVLGALVGTIVWAVFSILTELMMSVEPF